MIRSRYLPNVALTQILIGTPTIPKCFFVLGKVNKASEVTIGDLVIPEALLEHELNEALVSRTKYKELEN